MNIIEKRRSQLRLIGIIILVLGLTLAITGIVLLCNAGIGSQLNGIKLMFGIVLILFGLTGLVAGVFFIVMSSSIKATQGSIAEDNSLAKGTANMHKCENCGAEVEAGVKICAKCEENLKP